MEKFTVFNGLVAPPDRANVDTDQIIPKQYLCDACASSEDTDSRRLHL